MPQLVLISKADADAALSQLGNDVVDPEAEAELNAEDGETPVSLTLRYLGNVVAWISATDALLRNKAVSENVVPLQLRLMNTPPPLEPHAMGNMRELFCTAAGTITQQPGEETAVKEWRDAWLDELIHPLSATDSTSQPRNPTFSGTIHYEAALMGAIANNELEDTDVLASISTALIDFN